MKLGSQSLQHRFILTCLGLSILLSGLLFPIKALAACTQVGSNVTSCPGTQLPCSVVKPISGIQRFCCVTSDECKVVQSEIKDDIKAKLDRKQTWYPDQGCTDAINTAFGCLPYDIKALGPTLFGFLVGFAGMIALFLMLFASSLYMTASGDHEKLKKAKELFTAATTGLIFIVFSVTLLRITAGDIIKLPDFQQNLGVR